MGTLNVYGVGGAGINIAKALKEQSKNIVYKKANYVLMDTSDRNVKNLELDNKSSIILMEDADGGGKERATNVDKINGFVDNTLRTHSGGDFNVVIYSSGGGSGGPIAPVLVKELLKAGKCVLNIIVVENSDSKGSENNFKTFGNLELVCKTVNAPIIFKCFENEGGSRGDINKSIINTLDMIGLLFNPNLKEMDGTDINHFFFYNKVTDAKPILSGILIEDGKDTDSDNIVSVASLYTNEDNITANFTNVGYKTTGVLVPSIKVPTNLTEVHFCIDYGKSYKHVKDMCSKIKESLANKTYSNLNIDFGLSDELENEDGIIV